VSVAWEDTGWEEWGFDLRTRKLIMQAWLENTKTINPLLKEQANQGEHTEQKFLGIRGEAMPAQNLS